MQCNAHFCVFVCSSVCRHLWDCTKPSKKLDPSGVFWPFSVLFFHEYTGNLSNLHISFSGQGSDRRALCCTTGFVMACQVNAFSEELTIWHESALIDRVVTKQRPATYYCRRTINMSTLLYVGAAAINCCQQLKINSSERQFVESLKGNESAKIICVCAH